MPKTGEETAQPVGKRRAVAMPGTKAEAQAILKRFGITGLKVESIADDRMFLLTPPMLHADNTMKRQARTVVLVQVGDLVEAIGPLVGWHVDDDRPWIMA